MESLKDVLVPEGGMEVSDEKLPTEIYVVDVRWAKLPEAVRRFVWDLAIDDN